MKTIVVALVFAASLSAGCKDALEVDRMPPFEPRGIYTETGDGFIRISWLANQEPDLAAYRVYVSGSYDGTYEMIGETSTLAFVDYDASNGITAYYAVTAVDQEGNESDLSTDVVYDTPRPEGSGVALPNFRLDPSRAGYDFSTYSVGPYDDQFTDIFFDHVNGTHYLVVWDDTEIQDMGYTSSLGEIGYAPTAGWSPSRDVRLIVGHTYVVRTWDDHYAKVRVRTLSDTRLTFDWAYQLQPGNTRLKQAATRGPLRAGPGLGERGE